MSGLAALTLVLRSKITIANQCYLVKSVDFTHGGFQMERSNVLPSLLQQGNEEVDGQLSIGELN